MKGLDWIHKLTTFILNIAYLYLYHHTQINTRSTRRGVVDIIVGSEGKNVQIDLGHFRKCFS